MNPSAADELSGDKTVDFLIAYAKNHGYGNLLVVNTSPVIKGSKTIADDFPLDDENWAYINYALKQADIVLGWGENGDKAAGYANRSTTIWLNSILGRGKVSRLVKIKFIVGIPFFAKSSDNNLEEVSFQLSNSGPTFLLFTVALPLLLLPLVLMD